MSTARNRGRLARSLAVTVALVGTSVALLPAPSAQATVTGTLTGGSTAWGISTYLNSANPGRPNPYPAGYVAPSTFDATSRISTWGSAAGTVASDGVAALSFTGTAVNYAPTSGSWLKLADPQVTLDAAGNGTVTAIVSYGTAPGSNPVPYDDSTPTQPATRVDVVNLTGNAAADRTTTPAAVTWTGLDGAWDPDFITFLSGPTASPSDDWPYVVTFTGAADRLPSPFTFTANRAVPTVAVSTTATNPTTGVTLKVTGDGFRGVTNAAPPPADNGIYVGLAPAGTMPDVTSMAGMASFAASAYIPASAMTTGAISTSLTATPDKLEPTKSYAIYTWQAHTHSNTTQDTQTPVTINWQALKQSTTVAASWKKEPKLGKKSKLAVAVSAAAGKPTGSVTVTLALKGSEKTKKVTGTLAAGAVVLTLPKLKPGKWTLTTTYSGDGGFGGSETTSKLKLKKK